MKKRIIISILIVAVLLISTGCCARQQYGPSFTEEMKANKGTQWFYGFNSPMKAIVSAPLRLNDNIYVTSIGGVLYCIDAERGQRVEQFKFNNGKPLKGGFRSKAVTDGNVIIVGNFDHNLYFVDPITGAKKLTIFTNDKIEGAPVIMDDRIYVANWEGRVYCFDLSNGEEIWYHDVADKVRCTPAGMNGRLYFGDCSGTFYCLSVGDDPDEIWRVENIGEVYGEPVTDGEYVWVTSLNGKIYCFNAVDGSQKWVRETGAEIWAGPHISLVNPVSPPVGIVAENIMIDDGITTTVEEGIEPLLDTAGEVMHLVEPLSPPEIRLYVGSMDANFYILDALTGELASYEDPESGERKEIKPFKIAEGIMFDNGIRCTAVTDETQVYFGAGDFGFRALDKVTGELSWTFLTRGQTWGKPLVIDDIVVFGSEDTYFYGLKTKSGNPVKGGL